MICEKVWKMGIDYNYLDYNFNLTRCSQHNFNLQAGSNYYQTNFAEILLKYYYLANYDYFTSKMLTW